MKRRSITAILVLAITYFILGVVSFGFSFLMLIGTSRLIFASLGALLFVFSIVEFFLFLYHKKRTKSLPKEASPEEAVERWMRR